MKRKRLPSRTCLKIRQYVRSKEVPEDDRLDDWIAERSTELECDPEDFRQRLLEEQENLAIEIGADQRTHVQLLANKAGLTRAKVLRRINEGLDATEKIVRSNRDGEITYEDEVPNWAMRSKFVDHGRAVLGLDAPRSMNIEHDISDKAAQLTQAELVTRLLELAAGNPEIAEQLKRIPTPSLRLAGRAASEAGASGQVVLDAALHEDEGRTG